MTFMIEQLREMSPMLSLVAIVSTASALGCSLLWALGFGSMRAERVDSVDEYVQRRRDLREFGIPALFAVPCGLLVSLAASLLLSGFDPFEPEWGTLVLAVFLLLGAVGGAGLTVTAISRARRRDSEQPPPALIRALADAETGTSPGALRFLAVSRRRLNQLASPVGALNDALPGFGDDVPGRIAAAVRAVPAHPALPLREVLSRPQRRRFAALWCGMLRHSAEIMEWPASLPFLCALCGFGFGFFDGDGGLPGALLYGGAGLLIGAIVAVAFFWTLGLTTLRQIAARRYEREEAERALDALEHRIRRGRGGLQGVWRRLTER